MDPKKLMILVLEDDEDDFILIREYLSRVKVTSYTLVWAQRFEDGLAAFEKNEFSAILVDYYLGEKTGLDFIQEITARGSKVPTILMTSQGNRDLDLNAMNSGAVDYLPKQDLSPALLERSIRYALDRKETELKLRKDAEKAEWLSNLSMDFTEAGLDFNEMIRSLPSRIANVLGDGCIVHILTEDGSTLAPVAMDYPDPEVRKWMIQLFSNIVQQIGVGVVGRAAASKNAQLICNPTLEQAAEFIQPGFASSLRHYRVACIFVVPLRSRTRLFGTLTIIRYGSDEVITPDERTFYIDLANRAGMAMENAALHKEVQRLAITDALTGLLNRRGFAQLGDREIERFHRYGHPLSMIMLDIDHFKGVNDTYGHAFGDEVLKSLASSCQMNVRSMDLIGRFGGDEFIILLPETDMPSANEVAERIRENFSKTPFSTDAGSHYLSVSLGIADAWEGIKDLNDLIQRADHVLYLAKQKGRDRVER